MNVLKAMFLCAFCACASFVAAGCATTADASGASAPTQSNAPEIPCNTDSECHGGTCRMGTCRGLPAAAVVRGRCSFDSECPHGKCVAGACMQQQSVNRVCNFDSDCPSGACRNNRCGESTPDDRH